MRVYFLRKSPGVISVILSLVMPVVIGPGPESHLSNRRLHSTGLRDQPLEQCVAHSSVVHKSYSYIFLNKLVGSFPLL